MTTLSNHYTTIAALLVLATGCTTHHQRPPTNAELRAADEVLLVNGQSIDIDDASLASNDEIVTRKMVYVANDVREVTDVNRAMGMLQGLGIGTLTGAVTGAIMGFVDGDDDTINCYESAGPCFSFDAGEKAALGGFVWGVLGGITGTIIGGIKGKQDVYHYGTSTPQFGVAIVPTDGGGQFSLNVQF